MTMKLLMLVVVVLTGGADLGDDDDDDHNDFLDLLLGDADLADVCCCYCRDDAYHPSDYDDTCRGDY